MDAAISKPKYEVLSVELEAYREEVLWHLKEIWGKPELNNYKIAICSQLKLDLDNIPYYKIVAYIDTLGLESLGMQLTDLNAEEDYERVVFLILSVLPNIAMSAELNNDTVHFALFQNPLVLDAMPEYLKKDLATDYPIMWADKIPAKTFEKDAFSETVSSDDIREFIATRWTQLTKIIFSYVELDSAPFLRELHSRFQTYSINSARLEDPKFFTQLKQLIDDTVKIILLLRALTPLFGNYSAPDNLRLQAILKNLLDSSTDLDAKIQTSDQFLSELFERFNQRASTVAALTLPPQIRVADSNQELNLDDIQIA